MTDRAVTDLVERAILGAQEEGAFDDLPGAGSPIPGIDRPYDPAWWARRWIERDRGEARINQLRTEVGRDMATALALDTAEEVRGALEMLNRDIIAANRAAPHGEPIECVDVAAAIRRLLGPGIAASNQPDPGMDSRRV